MLLLFPTSFSYTHTHTHLHIHTHTCIDVLRPPGAKETTPNDAIKKKDYQLPFDRQIVTSKLASALIMNGMDDLSTDDMNRLVHFFTLLVKTNHVRSNGLSFAEVPIRLGLTSSSSANSEDPTTSASVSGNDLDIDIGELMKEVENHLAKEASNNSELNTIGNDSSNGMESLTDSDLQTLLQNFKFLSNEEQVHLIGHLRKLEVLEPARVERLRKYVNIAELSSDGESCSDYLSRVVAITRPGAGAAGAGTAGGTATRLSASAAAVRRKSFERENALPSKLQRRSNLPPQRTSPTFMLDDDDDDDYNFDDLVIKANDTNGRKTSTSSSTLGASSANNPPIVPMLSSPNALTFKPAAPKISLKDTENIIANLMGTLTSNSNQQASNAANKAAQQQQQQQAGARNLPNRMQQQQQSQSLRPPQMQQYGPNGSVGVGGAAGAGGGGVSGANSYYNYGSDQMSGSNSVAYPVMPQQQPSQQQQQQQSVPSGPYGMGNYNPYGGPAMGHGYGGQMNPWASGPPQQGGYGNMPPSQNYLQPQQQQPPPLPQQAQSAGHYGNMYGGHQ